MQIIASLLMLGFIGMVMAALFTFGFVLFVWFMIVAAIFSAVVMLRQFWYGKSVVYTDESSPSIKTIEGEYKDVSGE